MRGITLSLALLILLEVAATSGEVELVHLSSLRCNYDGFGFTPGGISFDQQGRLFIVDRDNRRLFVFDQDLTNLELFSDCLSESIDVELVDVFADLPGRVYVSDGLGNRIFELDHLGQLKGWFPIGIPLKAIAITPQGRVYAASPTWGIVRVKTLPDQPPIDIYSESHQSCPVDVAPVPSRYVLVLDACSKNILMLNLLGNVVNSIGIFEVESPSGFGVLSQGLIIVSDGEHGGLHLFSVQGEYLGRFDGKPLKEAGFVAVRGDGTVCVCDPSRMTIEVFRIEGFPAR